MTVDEARDHIGATVLYHPHGTAPENGVLRQVSERFVFVVHRGDHLGIRATNPEDITLAEASAPLPAVAAGPVRRAAVVPVIEDVPVQGVLFAPSVLSAATAAGKGNQ